MAAQSGAQIYDKERIQLNLAKLKKAGERYEIVVDPDLAIAFKQGKEIDIKEVLKSEKIMNDAQKGIFASENRLKQVFETDDPLKIAETILKQGEIQLTTEYRAKLRQDKLKKIIGLIHANGIDPKSGLPHPPQRIENAINEVKVKVDNYKSAEDQVNVIVDQLRPVLPIRFEINQISVTVPAQFSSKSYAIVKRFAKIIKEDWNNDGSLSLIIEIPAGLREEFFDKINVLTHGETESKILEKK